MKLFVESIRSAILAGFCVLLAGCVSTELVKTMMKDIDGLKKDNEDLRQQVKNLDQEVKGLKNQAGDTAGTPDSGGSPGIIPGSGGGEKTDFLANLGKPDRQPGSAASQSRPTQLKGEEAYANAQSLYNSGKFREAYQAFSQASFLDPDEEFQARCHYWMGESMFSQGAYQKALDHFGTVFVQFGTTSKASDALLKIGFTYYELANYNGARQALNEFIQRFPDHRAVPLANERLERLAGMETDKGLSDQ